MKKLYFLVLLMPSILIKAQNTSIDYVNNSSISSTACNVFNPSINIGGLLHTSWAGGVTYNSNNGLQLSTNPQGSPAGGTAFLINYNFVSGYNYTISVTATGHSALILNTRVILNTASFPSNSNTACGEDPNVIGYQISPGYGAISHAVSNNVSTYTSPSFSISGE